MGMKGLIKTRSIEINVMSHIKKEKRFSIEVCKCYLHDYYKQVLILALKS